MVHSSPPDFSMALHISGSGRGFRGNHIFVSNHLRLGSRSSCRALRGETTAELWGPMQENGRGKKPSSKILPHNRCSIWLPNRAKLGRPHSGLLSHGYSRVLFFETHCPQDGIWRIGVAEEQETYCCPKCNAACEVNFIAEGFTKRSLSLDPQFIAKPLRTIRAR